MIFDEQQKKTPGSESPICNSIEFYFFFKLKNIGKTISATTNKWEKNKKKIIIFLKGFVIPLPLCMHK